MKPSPKAAVHHATRVALGFALYFNGTKTETTVYKTLTLNCVCVLFELADTGPRKNLQVPRGGLRSVSHTRIIRSHAEQLQLRQLDSQRDHPYRGFGPSPA